MGPSETSNGYEPVRNYIASQADRRRLLSPPWGSSAGLSAEQLMAHVRSALESDGTWTDLCELRMGGGPTATIDLVKRGGERWFRATGGIGLTISAEYDSLETALDMVHAFARLAWDIHLATYSKDPHPWDPRPQDL